MTAEAVLPGSLIVVLDFVAMLNECCRISVMKLRSFKVSFRCARVATDLGHWERIVHPEYQWTRRREQGWSFFSTLGVQRRASRARLMQIELRMKLERSKSHSLAFGSIYRERQKGLQNLWSTPVLREGERDWATAFRLSADELICSSHAPGRCIYPVQPLLKRVA